MQHGLGVGETAACSSCRAGRSHRTQTLVRLRPLSLGLGVTALQPSLLRNHTLHGQPSCLHQHARSPDTGLCPSLSLPLPHVARPPARPPTSSEGLCACGSLTPTDHWCPAYTRKGVVYASSSNSRPANSLLPGGLITPSPARSVPLAIGPFSGLSLP